MLKAKTAKSHWTMKIWTKERGFNWKKYCSFVPTYHKQFLLSVPRVFLKQACTSNCFWRWVFTQRCQLDILTNPGHNSERLWIQVYTQAKNHAKSVSSLTNVLGMNPSTWNRRSWSLDCVPPSKYGVTSQTCINITVERSIYLAKLPLQGEFVTWCQNGLHKYVWLPLLFLLFGEIGFFWVSSLVATITNSWISSSPTCCRWSIL